MRKLHQLVLLAAVSIQGIAWGCASEWTTTDTVLATVATTAMLVDYKQTTQAAGNQWISPKGVQLYEANPLLGKMPTKSQVRNHFAVAALASVALTCILPPKQRRQFLTVLSVVEVGATLNNGVRFGLKGSW